MDDFSWQDVVNRFVRDDGDEAAGRVCEALNELLGETGPDEQLAKILENLGCYYWAGSPSEMRVWLENLNAKLQVQYADLVLLERAARAIGAARVDVVDGEG